MQSSRRATRNFLAGSTAVLMGSVFLPALATQARADFVTQQIIQNVIQNVLQDVRDQIQSRRLGVPPMRALRFSGDDADSASADSPFNGLLGYAAMPTKAPPMAAPMPSYIYGLNLTGSVDSGHAAGTTSTTVGVTGAVDVTRIGIFNTADAFTVIFTGSGLWTRAAGTHSDTDVAAGTVAYTNGGFSIDFTVDPNWTSAAGMKTSGVAYNPNVHYKFDLANAWFIEPYVGLTFSEAYLDSFGAETGHSTEVEGGARIGTETVWNGTRVQPSLTGALFSMVDESGTAAAIGAGGGAVGLGNPPTGVVGGKGSGKLNFLWTDHFSSFIEAHGSDIAGISDIGGQVGLRWTN